MLLLACVLTPVGLQSRGARLRIQSANGDKAQSTEAR
jgi:hypothetical protein